MNVGFANALRKLRMDAGLTTAELAARVGLERWQIMEWECGESIPTTDEFVRLLEALGVSAERLMGNDTAEGKGASRSGRIEVIKHGAAENEGAPHADRITVIRHSAADGTAEDASHADRVVVIRPHSADDSAGSKSDSPADSVKAAAHGYASHEFSECDDERDEADVAYEPDEDELDGDGLDGDELDEDELDEDEPDEDEPDEDDDIDDEPLLGDGVKVSFDRILRLAPFMSGDALGVLARRAMEQETPDYRLIVKLAPFLPSRVLDEMVSASAPEEVDWKLVQRLSPFLGKDTLARLVDAATSGSQPDWRIIVKLAPFLPSKTLIAMANIALGGNQPDWHAVEQLAPFLPGKFLDNLVISMLNRDGGWDE